MPTAIKSARLAPATADRLDAGCSRFRFRSSVVRFHALGRPLCLVRSGACPSLAGAGVRLLPFLAVLLFSLYEVVKDKIVAIRAWPKSLLALRRPDQLALRAVVGFEIGCKTDLVGNKISAVLTQHELLLPECVVAEQSSLKGWREADHRILEAFDHSLMARLLVSEDRRLF